MNTIPFTRLSVQNYQQFKDYVIESKHNHFATVKDGATTTLYWICDKSFSSFGEVMLIDVDIINESQIVHDDKAPAETGVEPSAKDMIHIDVLLKAMAVSKDASIVKELVG